MLPLKQKKQLPHAVKIHERWLFLYVYPIIAVLVVHIGNDNPLSVLITIPSYYSDLLLALVSAYGSGFYFRWLYSWIDSRYSFREKLNTHVKRSALYGIMLGVFLPCLAVISLEALYLLLIGIPLGTSSILYLELPMVFIFCALINLVYILLYYRSFTHHLEERIVEAKEEGNAREKKSFPGRSGNKTIIVPESEVAYFMSEDKLTILVSKSGQRLIYDNPIREVAVSLPSSDFFPINRQMVIQKQYLRVSKNRYPEVVDRIESTGWKSGFRTKNKGDKIPGLDLSGLAVRFR